MNQVVPKDDDKFLTTASSWDLEALIENLPNNSTPTCLIQIEPQTGKTGFLEERGKWIKELWNNIIVEGKPFEAHRSGWTELIIFSPAMEFEKFVESITEILKTSTDNKLKSLALFSVVNGTYSDKITEIEKMGIQFSKINYWKDHTYSSYFENGIEKNLKTT